MPLQQQHKTDSEILQAYYADADNYWLGILLQRYTTLLLGVCMKYLKNEDDAKDAVQQVFLKVIHELPKYKVDYFKSWLYMVAKNHCLMKLRGAQHQTIEIKDSITVAADNYAEIANQAQQKETTLNNLDIAITQLKGEQKECITLFYLQKLSYQQIIEQTSFTAMQVKSNIQNGKRNLKIILDRLQKNEQ